MKVLLLTDGIFPFQIGGMQKHSLMLAKFLIKNGVHVHLVHCGGNDYSPEMFLSLFDQELQEFISETYVKFPKSDPFPGHYIRENKTYSKNAYFELESRMNEFDLVYAQGFSGWRFIKERRKKQFTCPVIVNFHGLEMFQTPPSLRVMAEYSLFKNAVKWNLRNADYVYSFGGEIDEILKELEIHKDVILPQVNGIESNWMVTNPSDVTDVRKFVFVGRAERRKGIEELNKTLELLIANETPFEFNFIGPIPEKQRIIDTRIIYHGEIREPEEIKKILRGQDCLVCPSHSEGMPTVILEAMASGLAIIGTNVGAIEKQIENNGILIKEPDSIELKKAMDSIINADPTVLQSMKKESLSLIEQRFLWERVVESKLTQFQQILSKEKRVLSTE